MDELDRGGAFANSGGDPLDRAAADVAGGEHARQAGLQLQRRAGQRPAVHGLTVRNPETAQSAGFLWMFPLTFASAAFAPAASMPGWLQPFVEANPITVLTEALRALTTGGPAIGPVLQSIAWIGGLTLVFAPLAIRQYRRLA
jgi:ABC-2 family transporter protein